MEVEPGVTSGDFLSGFYLGTREALYEKGRESITLIVREVSPFTIGMLIALFERAVGFYASLVQINAYHQPGVEAGKKAAGAVIAMQSKLMAFLKTHPGTPYSVSALADGVGCDDNEMVFKICEHLAANPGRGVTRGGGAMPLAAQYRAS